MYVGPHVCSDHKYLHLHLKLNTYYERLSVARTQGEKWATVSEWDG